MSDTVNTQSNAPLVSVTMPTYNRAHHLPGSIESILGQTFKDFEFIIIDDGSTDNTAEVVARYKDPRIIYARYDRNRGVSYSANRGIEMARGKYIARADSDDINMPNRLAKTVAYLEANPEVGVVGGHAMYNFKDGKHMVRLPLSNDECRATLLFHPCFMQPAITFRRDVLVKQGFRYDENYRSGEDCDLWTRMMWATQYANMDEVLVEYNCHGDQLSAVWSNESYEQRLVPILRVLEKFQIQDKGIAEVLMLAGFLYRDIELEDIQKLRDVFQLITSQNALKHAIEPNALRRVLERKWGLFCAHATKHGLPTFKAYWSAELSLEQRFSKMTAKILAKSILRRN